MNGFYVFGLIVIALMAIDIFLPYDDTDDKENKDRSGLILYVDKRTGLHYIKGGFFGGITPRLDDSGKQIQDKKGN